MGRPKLLCTNVQKFVIRYYSFLLQDGNNDFRVRFTETDDTKSSHEYSKLKTEDFKVNRNPLPLFYSFPSKLEVKTTNHFQMPSCHDCV